MCYVLHNVDSRNRGTVFQRTETYSEDRFGWFALHSPLQWMAEEIEAPIRSRRYNYSIICTLMERMAAVHIAGSPGPLDTKRPS